MRRLCNRSMNKYEDDYMYKLEKDCRDHIGCRGCPWYYEDINTHRRKCFSMDLREFMIYKMENTKDE